MLKLQTLTTRNTITFPIVLLISTMLSGCLNGGLYGFNHNQTPKLRIADYSGVDCNDIWLISDSRAYENALYWLQLMHCVKNLSAKQAQGLLAENVGDANWVDLFKRSILLAQINGSDSEQRQTLDKLARGNQKQGTALNRIIDLWVKNQRLQLALNVEKNRYQRLKESTETNERALNNELQSVQAKLQSLANIETDILSNRKSAKNDETRSTSTTNSRIETVADSQTKEEQHISPDNNN